MSEKTYIPDAPCKNGHMSPRYLTTRTCCECDRAKHAKFRAANREKRSAYNKRYWGSYQRPPSDPAKCADYYERNKADCLRRSKAHRQNNKERYACYQRARRARAASAGGSHTDADVVEIFQSQKGRCGYCRVSVRFEQKQVDHIIPIARGGHNGRSNIQILCKPCNVRKSAIDPIEFAKRIGRLI